MKIDVILFGATGMVGEGVLLEILNHQEVERILLITRRASDFKHPRVHEIIHDDFFKYNSIEEKLKGYQACFFCLGTTSVGKNEMEYTLTTYDITISAAETLSKVNPGMVFCYVSGQGTDSTENGKLMWARVKGKTENDLMKFPFKAVYNFRPGFIKPLKGQTHAFLASKIIGIFYPVMNIFLSKYICKMEDIALSMIHVATEGYSKHILENKDITSLGKLYKSSH
ncbi:MAG: epimerase [Ignavibacteriales bacterium]|nr:MAG: epimerase [Ignavibacteriales bacterium]